MFDINMLKNIFSSLNTTIVETTPGKYVLELKVGQKTDHYRINHVVKIADKNGNSIKRNDAIDVPSSIALIAGLEKIDHTHETQNHLNLLIDTSIKDNNLCINKIIWEKNFIHFLVRDEEQNWYYAFS